MGPREHPCSRDRSKGVAALELALSLSFLVPLMLAALDFGYYFYVGATAEEAARQGVQQAVRQSAGQPCGSAPANNAYTIVHDTYPATTGIACLGADNVSATYCYMNEPPLGMGGVGGATEISNLTCDNNPVANSWHIQVDVSFKLVAGFYKPLLPAGTGSGTVRYRASLTATP
jgi:Flp pilus assembly protein TadG